MSKEYAIYPFKKMGISQRHNQGNHTAHHTPFKKYSDKPWDEACGDSGRDYFIPQNDFKVEEILGLNTTKVTNTVRLVSVNKLYTPFKSTPDYLKLTLTHMAEEDIRKLKKGQILKKGSMILREGTDGQATGNHFHCTANFGKYYGFLQNGNGKWCFVYEKSLLPNEAFYLDKTFTTVKSYNGYDFKTVPAEPTYKKVNSATGLWLRAGLGTSSKKIKLLAYNTKVEIITSNYGSSNGYVWSKVKYGDTTGFVASKYLK